MFSVKLTVPGSSAKHRRLPEETWGVEIVHTKSVLQEFAKTHQDVSCRKRRTVETTKASLLELGYLDLFGVKEDGRSLVVAQPRSYGS